ncbi:dinitrogenase iron-molybdenum cofactor [Thermococcus sp. GR7]|uniref:NifB/NifX family molybdenum-iron cluster-binding protein n=1 Tax=unclassified Thermococcus TaxID=2627626 RepID=UPI001431F480|nr:MULTISPECIES: NifB/NifX family molybdenum-iron cluster-binding protein [unclassified Thermococcus]NJE47563.1 dinitrogenase iron-molybdenum cofactor [Thermococcus sp. GR7]NJE79345.1 dinitrogenase iron-molybdenum cofactor [Thermococcus sp. GR4]NJF22481.1 dinitrogenase iron-molybdenum cofactor [Thermococcus sp. GR5]
MRIAIPTNGGGLEDTVAPVFARAPAFVIVEVDEKGNVTNSKVIQNGAAMAGGGAGPFAIQTLINEGVEAVIAPQVGPNALGALQAAGIRLYQIAPGTPVEEAIKAVTTGSVQQLSTPAPATPVAPAAPSPAYGPYAPAYPAYPAYGYGWGRGGGWSRGRGFGRGWGKGGRGWGVRLGYCPWTGRPNRRTLRWLYGWW